MWIRILFLAIALAALPTKKRADDAVPKPEPQAQQLAHPNVAPSTAVGGHGRGGSGTVTAIPVDKIKVEAVKLKGGETGWKVKVPGGRALATPAVADGMVFVGGGFGSNEFYAFDAETGKARWGVRVSDDGPTAAVVAEGMVVFNTESCTLFVVEAKTGKQVWSRWLGDPLMSQPAVASGVVYMVYPGDGGHRLIALTLAKGKELWKAKLSGDAITAPVVDGDSVYTATNDGTVYRHRLTDGKELVKKEMQATSAPTIVAGEIRVSQGVNKVGGKKGEGLRALDLAGKEKTVLLAEKEASYLEADVQGRSGYAHAQKSDDASVGFSSAPATAKVGEASKNLGQGSVRGLWEYQGSRPLAMGDTNYASQGDTLRSVDSKTGKLTWEKKLGGDEKAIGGHLATPPALAAGKLVIGTATGQVVGFEAKDGKEAFRYEVGEQVRFQPALAKGRIFVGTASGTLMSIATGDKAIDGWTMWGGGPKHNGPEGG